MIMNLYLYDYKQGRLSRPTINRIITRQFGGRALDNVTYNVDKEKLVTKFIVHNIVIYFYLLIEAETSEKYLMYEMCEESDQSKYLKRLNILVNLKESLTYDTDKLNKLIKDAFSKTLTNTTIIFSDNKNQVKNFRVTLSSYKKYMSTKRHTETLMRRYGRV